MTKKLSLYLVFLAVLTVGLYGGIKNYVTHQATRVVWKTRTVIDPPARPILNTDKLTLQPALTHSQVIVPSPEGSEFAVLTQPNTLTFVNAQSGRVVSRTVLKDTIRNVTWISDRLLFIMTNSNTLWTDDVQAQKVRLIHSFQVPSSQSFQTIAFSAYTNDVFVIFGNQSRNTVYQYNTNEQYYIRNIGNISVVNAYYQSTNMTLFMENMNHTLYQLKNGDITRLQQHAAILKGAGNVLFYARLNSKNQVVSVAEYDDHGQSHLIADLPTPVPVADVVVDHSGKMFIAGPYDLLDVLQKRTWVVPKGFRLKVAGSNLLLMRGGQYQVVVN
jgi:WD40 repeat protein